MKTSPVSSGFDVSRFDHVSSLFFGLLVLLWLSLPFSLPADQEGDYGYTTDGATVTITNYTGPGGVLVLPATITNLPVVAIGYRAFYWHTGLTALTISASVTNIDTYVFANCTSLTAVDIPHGVKRIGQMAFYFCSSLRSLTLPAGITKIDDWTFAFNRNLTNLTLPDSVTNIATHAFYGVDNYLTRLTIPESVQTIGRRAFANMYNLVTLTAGGNLTSLADDAFADCPNLKTAFFKGDAPAIGTNIFHHTDHVTVYYLPGTTGWGETFSGRPTALWLPRILVPGVRTNQFGFHIAWAGGMTVAVEGCTNLRPPSWVSLQTNALTSDTLYFTDPQWATRPTSFYRLRAL